jgi:amidase
VDVARSSAAELLHALAAGELTAVEITQRCLTRIAEDDGRVNAVIALDPTALDQARAADERRAAGSSGALLGLPILIKDNIAVTGAPTTAGSRALADSAPPDAPLVTRLRAAGAVVLGKTNLSEWANFRSRHSTSGWSAVGGQTRNPHVLDRNPSGSSSGSAAAVAAGFAPIAIGTETDGSIVSPAGICGVVGFKPTLGRVPGAGIVPVSSAQDVAGPMTRTVLDAAEVYGVLSGRPRPVLDADALRGARVGVWLPAAADRETRLVFDAATAALVRAGATTVPVMLESDAISGAEWPALLTEFRDQLDAYLAAAPGALVRDLAALIAFNRADDLELSRFGQDNLEQALAAPGPDDPTYQAARAATTSGARALIDDTLAAESLDVIVTLSNGPAWKIDYTSDDAFDVLTSTPAAAAGYPTISVPAGFVGPLPIGVSFLATGGADERVLTLAYAFEQATAALRPPAYLSTID